MTLPGPTPVRQPTTSRQNLPSGNSVSTRQHLGRWHKNKVPGACATWPLLSVRGPALRAASRRPACSPLRHQGHTCDCNNTTIWPALLCRQPSVECTVGCTAPRIVSQSRVSATGKVLAHLRFFEALDQRTHCQETILRALAFFLHGHLHPGSHEIGRRIVS